MRNRHQGFTIVELLIVIIVIAILAAITIITYNGVQTRAANSATYAAASNAVKLIRTYVVANDSYPFTAAGTNGACLTADTNCMVGGTAKTTNATLTNNLKATGTLPTGIPTQDADNYGIFYQYNSGRNLNGTAQPVVIVYYLKGANMDCQQPVTSGMVTNMTTPATPYSSSTGGITTCVVSIPGPAA